jgi:hypothetical protein
MRGILQKAGRIAFTNIKNCQRARKPVAARKDGAFLKAGVRGLASVIRLKLELLKACFFYQLRASAARRGVNKGKALLFVDKL